MQIVDCVHVHATVAARGASDGGLRVRDAWTGDTRRVRVHVLCTHF